MHAHLHDWLQHHRARFDHGFPERYPIFDERETGEVFLAEDQPAPEAADGPVHTPAQ